MEIRGRKVLVTGGAGFIGSHLVDRLVAEGCEVTVVDDLSTGRLSSLEGAMASGNVQFVQGDLLKHDLAAAMEGHDAVFHVAANPEVRIGSVDTWVHLEQNVTATHRVLEAMRAADVRDLLFTSTSTVYGEATEIPTPEDYGPLSPISLYGASKLAAEALIAAYCATFGLRAVTMRFANVVGPRSTHGVIHDFIQKLRDDATRLEILGRPPGTRKSYVHIRDCVDGMFAAWAATTRGCEAYNVGSEDMIDVQTIADIVVREMGLGGVAYEWTGGVDGGRGWRGDVLTMHLSIGKLKAAGWRPRAGSAEAVRAAAEAALKEAR